MKFGAVVLLAGVLAISLGACDVRLDKTDLEGNPVHGFLPNPQTVTQTINWDQTQSVALRVRNYDIDPVGLRLQQGLPYRLVIDNVGNYTCYFASEGAAQDRCREEAGRPVGREDFPYYEEIAVLPGETRRSGSCPWRRVNSTRSASARAIRCSATWSGSACSPTPPSRAPPRPSRARWWPPTTARRWPQRWPRRRPTATVSTRWKPHASPPPPPSSSKRSS